MDPDMIRCHYEDPTVVGISSKHFNKNGDPGSDPTLGSNMDPDTGNDRVIKRDFKDAHPTGSGSGTL